MIDLPTFAIPGSFQGTLNDAGFTQSGVQSDDYIPRKGSRYTVGFTYGPYTPDQGRIMVARLIAGKQGGVRIKLPILHSQGSPGSPVVASATGRTLAISGLTPGYAILEGYWLSLVKTGQHFLHSVGIGATASAGGTATIELNELLRDTFTAGSVVHLAQPQVEGLIVGDEWSWQFDANCVTPIEFTIKEVR
jgi:hypothetical protein